METAKKKSLRRAIVAKVISQADDMNVDEEREFTVKEAHIERNIRTSLSRRRTTGKVFEANMEGNILTIKRIA